MSIKKKITDFVRLEQGSIGGKAAMVTGAAMAAVVLAAATDVGEAKAKGFCHHTDILFGHINYTDYSNPAVSPHRNYFSRHANVYPDPGWTCP